MSKSRVAKDVDINEGASRGSWSKLISSQSLEDAVKSLQIDVQKSVTTPGRFRGGGYQDVRRQFSELALLFAVISEYEGQVRWKEQSTLARDLFARVAANAKVTSVQAFNDAKQRKTDLEDLIRGGRIESERSVEAANNWEIICDRGPLMERFTTLFEEGVVVWTSNANEMQAERGQLTRAAELIRLFSAVLTKEGMEDAGDDDYDAYCMQLQDATTSLLKAVERENLSQARNAVSDMRKACTACHDTYR